MFKNEQFSFVGGWVVRLFVSRHIDTVFPALPPQGSNKTSISYASDAQRAFSSTEPYHSCKASSAAQCKDEGRGLLLPTLDIVFREADQGRSVLESAIKNELVWKILFNWVMYVYINCSLERVGGWVALRRNEHFSFFNM